jgi:hypothetical protein
MKNKTFKRLSEYAEKYSKELIRLHSNQFLPGIITSGLFAVE